MKSIRVKLRRIAQFLPFLPRTFGLVWKAAPAWCVAWLALLIVQGFLPVATVYLTRALVDSLVAGLGGDVSWGTFRPTFFFVVLMALLMLLTEFLRSITSYVRLTQSELVRDHISNLIHKKSTDVDLSFYDSAEFFNRLHRARSEAGGRPIRLLESLGSFMQNGITFIAMAVVLVTYSIWLPLALFVSTLPILYVVMQNQTLHHRWNRKVTQDVRRAWYYEWLLTARDTAAEVSAFRLGDHFRGNFQRLRRRLRRQRLALAWKEGVSEVLAGLVGLLATGLAMLWMVWKTVKGLFSLGDLALFYQAFNQGQRLMRSLLTHVGEIYANGLYIGDLFEFLEMDPAIAYPEHSTTAPKQLTEGLRLEGVTFRYPGREQPIFEDFSLEIPAGKVTSIVGANGSGKSTLLKLLCRFYDPEWGRVTCDGIDLRSLSRRELRRLVTIIFQDPVHYSATVSENILLGDLEREEGIEAVRKSAAAAGAEETIRNLPAGYDTMLGTWFLGGAELSGGEWQRIALARTLIRRAPVLLLDEPTSEMDPWAAVEWVRRFRSIVADRTAVIVTHRLSTARIADVIHVMDAGRIIESGSHEELAAAAGPYASLLTDQQ
jgi:ATP-binding cassette subfamily B protein